MMLIDSYYFTKGQRRIGSLTLGDVHDPNQAEIREWISGCIESYVPMYLCEMFGDCKGMEVYRHTVEPDVHADTTALDDLCRQLREPCADYVFFRMLEASMSTPTIDGLIRPKIADTYVAPITRQVAVWNDMVRKHRFVKGWLERHKELKGYEISQWMLTPVNRFNL